MYDIIQMRFVPFHVPLTPISPCHQGDSSSTRGSIADPELRSRRQLDLRDARSFRDLSLPVSAGTMPGRIRRSFVRVVCAQVGALNRVRLTEFEKRCSAWNDPTVR